MNEILQAEKDKQKWEKLLLDIKELNDTIPLKCNTLIDVTTAINGKLAECNKVLKCKP